MRHAPAVRVPVPKPELKPERGAFGQPERKSFDVTDPSAHERAVRQPDGQPEPAAERVAKRQSQRRTVGVPVEIAVEEPQLLTERLAVGVPVAISVEQPQRLAEPRAVREPESSAFVVAYSRSALQGTPAVSRGGLYDGPVLPRHGRQFPQLLR